MSKTVWVSLELHHAHLWVGDEKPQETIKGHYYRKQNSLQHRSTISRYAASLLGVKEGECKQFQITEVVE